MTGDPPIPAEEEIPESARPDTPAAPDPEPDPDAPGEPGALIEDANALLKAARDSLGAYVTGLRAFKRLFLAEAALARDAVVHGLVYLLLAMIGIGTAYALLTGLVVYLLHWAGIPLALALFLPLLASLALGWLTLRLARGQFRYADFEATRRQFERGLAPKPDNPDDPSPERTSSPAERDA